MSGYFRTAVLLAGLTGLFLAVGFLLGGQSGMMVALLVAIATNVFAYWNSDRMVLRMHNAQEVDPRGAPDLWRMVAQLSERAGLPMPRLYIIHSDQPNAFATGRDPEHAAVAVTTGLLERLTLEQTAGVVAHELAHIRNRDTLIMTVTACLAGAISMLAQFGFLFGGMGRDEREGGIGPLGGLLMMILAPVAAMLVQMAISRSREYEADRIGAEICGRPLWLAGALENISVAAHAIPNYAAERNPATAHMFIVNPLHGHAWDNLFATHPNMENRIARLRQMAGQGAPRRGPWG